VDLLHFRKRKRKARGQIPLHSPPTKKPAGPTPTVSSQRAKKAQKSQTWPRGEVWGESPPYPRRSRWQAANASKVTRRVGLRRPKTLYRLGRCDFFSVQRLALAARSSRPHRGQSVYGLAGMSHAWQLPLPFPCRVSRCRLVTDCLAVAPSPCSSSDRFPSPKHHDTHRGESQVQKKTHLPGARFVTGNHPADPLRYKQVFYKSTLSGLIKAPGKKVSVRRNGIWNGWLIRQKRI